jgi:adenine-specific DNA-methyltransferase
MSEDNLWGLDKDGRIWWGEDGNNVPSVKQFLSEVREGRVPQTLWFYHDVGHTQEAKKELFDIMGWDEGADQPFTTPKPKRLIDRILNIACENNAVVLDSFSGSGTTAHSVLAANKADGGHRSFILVEVEDYAEKTTAERVRRVINGVRKAKDDEFRQGLGGSFTYCELGEPIQLERFFDGKGAPGYEQVARYIVYTATGQSAEAPAEPRKDWFVAEAGGYRIHLIYKPDLTFMRGNEAALSLDLAKQIEKGAKGKPVLVYAAAKFMSQADLTRRGITFCQLPYSIHRVLGEAPDAT